MTDHQLFEGCKQNDQRAQRALYDRYAVMMLHLCQRYLKDETLAEEAMISGFQKILTNVDQFEWRSPAAFIGWMRRIMANESLMLLRKQKRLAGKEELNHQITDDSYGAAENIHAEGIYKLVNQLPDGYRTVFNLYVVEGYSHKEIAEKLNIQENTSKSQLSKARAQLKKWIKNLDML